VSNQLKRRKKISGMTWIFLGLLVFFISAAAFTAVVSPLRRGTGMGRITIAKLPPRSYFGTNTFETAEGGVTFTHVVPPGSPADKAGMVGGDIITSFDGKPVKEDDELREVLANTPVGKTVEVIYLRDGETHTTQLTTISKEEFDRLDGAFDQRPEGRGRFGYDDDNSERVPIPGTKLFGVRLNDISQSLPADMAGIKEGDIVIEFGGVPIRTPEELSWRVRRAIPYEPVTVVLMRNGEKLEIPVKMGKQ
jgi:S1-C subfamily serine protease